MTREEEIMEMANYFAEDNYDRCIGYKEGASWADMHPKSHWISVKDDLPCKHNDLRINNGLITKRVLVVEDNCVAFDRMAFRDNGWGWVTSICPSHWALIPKPPKE